MNTEFELHHELKDASLEKACDLAQDLARTLGDISNDVIIDKAESLHYMLEYLRLNYTLNPK